MRRPALLLAAVLVVPACHQDDDDHDSGGSPSGPPTAPSDLRAEPGDTIVTLSWSPVPRATGYDIKSATDPGGPYGLVEAGFTGTTFIDDTLTNGTTYYYVVSSVGAEGEGPDSAEVSATPTAAGPSPEMWTKHAGNPVFSPSADPFAWDRGAVFAPCVLRRGPGSWVMYYSGTAFPGGVVSIGRATSADGIAWTRSGPSPVLSPSGIPGSFDEASVMHPSVHFDGAFYRMWYSAGGAIGLATSTDGVVWTRYANNPVLDRGPQGAWDAALVESPSVIQDGLVFRMWYAGTSHTFSNAKSEIGTAESADGVAWTKYPTSILAATPGSIDNPNGIQNPTVLKDGATYRMWTNIPDHGDSDHLGAATSPDGLNWTKVPSNADPQPVLSVGPPGSWDGEQVTTPFVLREGATFRLFYSGIVAIGLATSP